MPSPAATRTAPPALTATAAAAAHAFAGLDDWIEIFSTGPKKDSKGNILTYTEADLDEMAANVTGAGVPHVIGHPKTESRAWAWSKPGDVKRDGNKLLALASAVNSLFRAQVDDGAYRERSIKVIHDPERGKVLGHIGWLGAAPPAVTDLAALQYAAPALPDGAQEHEFSAAEDMPVAWALGDIAALLRGLREWVIGKDGLDAADRVLPTWTIDSIVSAATGLADKARAEAAAEASAETSPYTAAAGATTTTTQGDPLPNPLTPEDLARAATDAAAAARTAAASEFAAQSASQAAELAALRAERQRERIAAQIGVWQAAGLPPAATEGLAEYMAASEGGVAEFEYTAAGAAAPAKQAPAAWFSAWVGKLLPFVKLGNRLPGADTAAELDTTDHHAIAGKAREYMAAEAAQGRIVSIEAAVSHVVRQAAS